MEHTVRIEVPEDADLEQAGETVTLSVDESESILSVARESGLWLPADCQQGWCTTCAARLLEGAVDQSAAKRYDEVDREADLILPCTAQPRSDLRDRGLRLRGDARPPRRARPPAGAVEAEVRYRRLTSWACVGGGPTASAS